MKKILLIAFLALTFSGCKNDKKKPIVTTDATAASLNTGTQIVRGEYIFFQDVAVLTTNSEIYEVIQDDNMKQLEKQAAGLKKDTKDMVMVTLKVNIVTNPKRKESQDVWEKAVQIKEVMEVKPIVNSQQPSTIK